MAYSIARGGHKSSPTRNTVTAISGAALLVGLLGAVPLAAAENPTEAESAAEHQREIARAGELIDQDGQTITEAEFFPGNQVFVRFDNGAWAITQPGSEFKTQTTSETVEGREGIRVSGALSPAEPGDPRFAAFDENAPTVTDIGVEVGVIPEEHAVENLRQGDAYSNDEELLRKAFGSEWEQNSLSATSGQTDGDVTVQQANQPLLSYDCWGIEPNGTGHTYSCWYLHGYSYQQEIFGVVHEGTATPAGIYGLTSFRNGVDYGGGTGQVVRYRPLTTQSENCSSTPIGGSYKGFELSVTITLCENLLPDIAWNGKHFDAVWEIGNRFMKANTPRDAAGTQWFERPLGTQSGKTYTQDFFAIP